MNKVKRLGRYTVTIFKARSNPENKAKDDNRVCVSFDGNRVYSDGGFATLSAARRGGIEFISRQL